MTYLARFAALLTAFFLPVSAHAASLDIDFPGVTLSEGGTFSGETRIVHFEVTEALTLTSLTARIGTVAAGTFGTTTTVDPVSTWTVSESDASASLGATVASVAAGIRFSSLTQEPGLYTTLVDIVLGPGYYFLGLKIDTPVLYTYFREGTPGVDLPLTTNDGAIRVLDGILIQEPNPDRVINANIGLPAYRIGYDLTEVPTSPVPLPAGGLLLIAGLGGLSVLRRGRQAG